MLGNCSGDEQGAAAVEGEEVGGCSGRADRAGELCQVRFEHCGKELELLAGRGASLQLDRRRGHV